MKDNKQSVAASSIFASFFLTVVKLIVGLMTGSMGILSEAVHSLLDLGATILTFFAIKFGDRPADDSHPYGHEKIESVSALIETGLLFVTSIWIIYEAIHRIIVRNTEVEIAWYAFAVVIISIIVDISRSRALIKVAKKTNSQALEADALHFSSDIWSSVVVLIGLILVMIGIRGADTFAAIGVSIFVMMAGYRLGKRTINILVDRAPDGISDIIEDLVCKVPGVIGTSNIRVRSLGSRLAIEVCIKLSRKLSLARASDIKKDTEQKIKAQFQTAEILVNIDLIQLDDETIVEAVQALGVKNNIPVHDVVVDLLDGKQYISYDLELPDTLNMKDAHAIATSLEEDVKNELGEEIELNSHIEPLRNGAVLSSDVSENKMDEIMAVLKEADKEVEEISEIHNVLARKIGDKFFVSFHCLTPAEFSLEAVHEATNRFECLMKERMKTIKRVVIHAEPIE